MTRKADTPDLGDEIAKELYRNSHHYPTITLYRQGKSQITITQRGIFDHLSLKKEEAEQLLKAAIKDNHASEGRLYFEDEPTGALMKLEISLNYLKETFLEIR